MWNFLPNSAILFQCTIKHHLLYWRSFSMNLRRSLRSVLILFLWLFLTACQSVAGRGDPLSQGSGDPAGGRVLDLRNLQTLDAVLPALAAARVVYVGEAHDDYAHHLEQLQIIRRLYALHPDLAIGMEQFQQPFQQVLDDYVAGRIDERELLRKSEWYDRWRFDYRLYRPILTFARENRIPVLALNVPRELTSKVSQSGMESLTPEERSRLPAEIDRSDAAYLERLERIFQQHPNADKQNFERFLQVQLLWDEGMAQRVADYLQQGQGRHMVVLAGGGHIIYGSGIPNRVTRRIAASRSIVMLDNGGPVEPGSADFLLYPPPATLPPGGLMGILMDDSPEGVTVNGVAPGSAAEKAGVQKDDLIRAIDGTAVSTAADVKIALLDRKPGETLRLSVLRDRLLMPAKEIELELVLGAK